MTEFVKILVFVLISTISSVGAAPPVVPKGFKVTDFATVEGARSMSLSPKGRIYVGSQDVGKLYFVENGKTHILAQNLIQPNGVAWFKGDLYVAEISKISVIRGVDKIAPGIRPKMEIIKSDFPSDYHHGWKYIAIGPDNQLYVPVGAPCNVCLKALPYSALHRLSLDGKKLETIAEGIRNTVGFTWHPKTKKIWFTDNGRDSMGDDIPSDEINIIESEKSHFGFPYYHAGIKDSFYFGQMPKGLSPVSPKVEIQAHSAPLGIIFTHGTPFADAYPGCFFVAQHGSWNRSSKVGYQVSAGCPDKKNNYTLKPFLTGMLINGQVSGRPVDLKFTKSGALLVSDDHAGKIWKIEISK